MTTSTTILSAASLIAALALPRLASAQAHEHRPGMTHPAGDTARAAAPTQAGQGAFAAIAEVVRLLEADPHTDWSQVNIERLRQHLIDMDDVVLRARVVMEPIPDGARFVVRGSGRTVGAVQRMARAHGAMLGAEGPYRVAAETLADGARVTVRAREAGDTATVRRIRALGFVGLLTVGDHHAPHHLLIARGAAMRDHGH
jgi:hypothetical protein